MNIEVTIDVSEATHARLEQRATAEGRTVRDLVSEQVAGSVEEMPPAPPAHEAPPKPTIAEKRAAYERLLELRESLTPLPPDKTYKELLYEAIDEKYG